MFFAIAQVVGAVGPAFYGALIGNGGNRANLAIGYLVGGGIMIIGGLVEARSGSTPRVSPWRRSRRPSPRSTPRARTPQRSE